MDAGDPPTADQIAANSRADRLADRRGWRRRTYFVIGIVLVVLGAGVGAYALATKDSRDGTGRVGTAAAATTVHTTPAHKTTTSRASTTTTTTLPVLKQPAALAMPAPGRSIGYGSRGPVVAFYEQRMKDLHMDPGPVDGVFDQRTEYAVTTVQKYYNLPRTGRIDFGVQAALSHFRYSPAEPNTEPNRVEIDLDRQVLTLFLNGQVALLTTTSTGSGEHFCGGVDGCQYAITPTGHFHFYELHRGWQKGKLGTMWNPYYFNGSDAVHGLASVPPYPASHGCARIPMHIADYFYTLVYQGMSVFVVGTPKHAGNGYVGPVPTPAPAPTTTPTTVVVLTPAPSTTPPTTVKVTPKTTPTTTPKTTPTTKKPPATTPTTKPGP